MRKISRLILFVFFSLTLMLSYMNCDKQYQIEAIKDSAPVSSLDTDDQKDPDDIEEIDEPADIDEPVVEEPVVSEPEIPVEEPVVEEPKFINMQQSYSLEKNNKVDILFVIDNSGSMSYEQKNMANRIDRFMTFVEKLDYRIGIVTTDPRDISTGDGRLLSLKNTNKYVIDKAMSLSEAQAALGGTLQRAEVGSGIEQGIYAVYRAIERSFDSSSTNATLFRNDAHLAVVVISDEDESAAGLKNKPEELLKLIQTNWNNQKGFSFNSIITIPNDKACLDGEGQSYGVKFNEMSVLTGGIVGSVCEQDYATLLSQIGHNVSQMVNSITLKCLPVIDAGHLIVVKKDGTDFSVPFSVDGVNLKFQDTLETGEYELFYDCKE